MTKRKPCVRQDGVLKLKRTREDAEQAAAEQRERTGQPYEPYSCPKCEHWHVGRRPQHARSFDWTSALCTEIGPRAFYCMVQESTGSVENRVQVIMHRGRKYR